MRKELGNFESMEQVEGNNGPVKNQFKIYTDKGTVFQSYSSVIAAKIREDENSARFTVYLDSYKWDYSVTTGKYRNIYLNETKKETERKIKDGTYKLADLNG